MLSTFIIYCPSSSQKDPAPLTEDVIEEQAKILVELGNDAEGSEQRAKMMSASLTSDMQSFKVS
jgi:Rab3 GTPase-activating protein catalytic subunit